MANTPVTLPDLQGVAGTETAPTVSALYVFCGFPGNLVWLNIIGGIRLVSAKNIYYKLGDALGVYADVLQDSAGTTVNTVDSLGRETLKAATAPGAVSAGYGSVYITASGVTPNREVALKYKNEASIEFVIFSWLV